MPQRTKMMDYCERKVDNNKAVARKSQEKATEDRLLRGKSTTIFRKDDWRHGAEKAQKKRTKIMTIDGCACIFPFKLFGQQHNQCMKDHTNGKYVCAVPMFHPVKKSTLCGFELPGMEPNGRYGYCNPVQRNNIGVKMRLSAIQGEEKVKNIRRMKDDPDFAKTSKGEKAESATIDKIQEKQEKKMIATDNGKILAKKETTLSD